MSKVIKLRKGLNIRIAGKAEKTLSSASKSEFFALKPTDFHGITPKLLVKEGDKVKAGTALFHDKNIPEIMFASPVSGTIHEVVRGERRAILEVVVKADAENSFEKFEKIDLKTANKQQIIESLLKSGLWTVLKQRPYGTIANPKDKPKAIFISTFDTAPLAADVEFCVNDFLGEFQLAIDAISKLTDGKVYLGINSENSIFKKISGVEFNVFEGKHPAGNVGVQIHHISPINKGEIVWTINPQDLVAIGKFLNTGVYDISRIIAVCGSEIKDKKYVKTIAGAQISELIKNNLEQQNVRFISGNVLTGTQISEKGFLGFYDTQLTVIPEGNQYEFFGWMAPGLNKFSASRTFFSWLMPKKEFKLNTNYHGGHRAYVITGQYEKVVPMDILPQLLVKAIMVDDIDKMEQLGIYELIEEDLALCDYVCTSKTEVQAILRRGLDLVKKEMS